MRTPLSSPSCCFLLFYSIIRTPNADRQNRRSFMLALPLVAGVMPPKRTSTLRQVSPLVIDSALVFRSLETTNAALPDWRLRESGPRSHGPRPCARWPATDFYPCRLTSLPRAGSRPKHPNLYSPTGDPPKPGTETTLLTRGGLTAKPVHVSAARTSPRRDVAVVSLVSLGLSSWACVLNLFAWGSGVGSAGVQPTRNTQADGAPKVPGAGDHHLRRRLFHRPPPLAPARPGLPDLTPPTPSPLRW